MYPYVRLAKVILQASMGKRLDFDSVGHVRMLVWPSDIDLYPEMNNGRHLTMMDLGRFDFAVRSGLFRLVIAKRWGFVIGGASVRFRHRLRPFRRFHLHTKPLGHDGRWFYFLQETEQDGRICSSALLRGGVRNRSGLVRAGSVLKAMGVPDWNPQLPEWVGKWIEADALRETGGSRLPEDRGPIDSKIDPN